MYKLITKKNTEPMECQLFKEKVEEEKPTNES